MGQLIRGYTDEIRMLNSEPLLGAVRDEWLDSVINRMAKQGDAPAKLFASVPTANTLLNISANAIEMGDGAAKSTPPVEDSIGTLVATTINMQTGAVVGGTVLMVGGGAFTLPASTLNYYRRFCLSLQSDGSLQVNFSSENVSLPALTNPGTLFAAMTGLPIGYVDLQCDNIAGRYRTANSTSPIIENKVGVYHTIVRFGAGGGGSTVEDTIMNGVTRKAPSQNAVYDALQLEATARFNADSTLQANINTEITARTNADSTLQTNINTEITARLNADSTLQANINTEITARTNADSTLQSNIGAEATARNLADATLQANINTEITARTNADSALQANINTEITARGNADVTLQANINTEITARTNADSTLQANINTEITARGNADVTLQANINTEITARTNADSTLQANISTEVTARIAADSTLQSNINALKWNTYTTASSSAGVALQDQIFWDTTAGICTAILPASPTFGSMIRLIDFKGTWGTNKLTVNRNGNKIQGVSSDLDLTVPWDTCTLVFDGVDNWHLLYG